MRKEKLQLKNRFAEIEAKLKEKQMSINLADAKSQAGGISGFLQRAWRPLIGMSCASVSYTHLRAHET